MRKKAEVCRTYTYIYPEKKCIRIQAPITCYSSLTIISPKDHRGKKIPPKEGRAKTHARLIGGMCDGIKWDFSPPLMFCPEGMVSPSSSSSMIQPLCDGGRRIGP